VGSKPAANTLHNCLVAPTVQHGLRSGPAGPSLRHIALASVRLAQRQLQRNVSRHNPPPKKERKLMNEMKARQLRRPTGLFGMYASKKLEKKNYFTYEYTLPLIITKENDKILEIGYGTGIVLNILAKRNNTLKLYGIDFSKVMYRAAKRKNKEYIINNQMFISYGDILYYNIESNFDVIYGINVTYFWDDLSKYLLKIHSLLNKEGKFYINMASIERLEKLELTNSPIFNKYSLQYVSKALEETGYKNIHYEINKSNIGDSYIIISNK
jgi:arsenite methyltransferase